MEEKNEIANTEKEGDSNTLSNNLNDNSQNSNSETNNESNINEKDKKEDNQNKTEEKANEDNTKEIDNNNEKKQINEEKKEENINEKEIKDKKEEEVSDQKVEEQKLKEKEEENKEEVNKEENKEEVNKEENKEEENKEVQKEEEKNEGEREEKEHREAENNEEEAPIHNEAAHKEEAHYEEDHKEEEHKEEEKLDEQSKDEERKSEGKGEEEKNNEENNSNKENEEENIINEDENKIIDEDKKENDNKENEEKQNEDEDKENKKEEEEEKEKEKEEEEEKEKPHERSVLSLEGAKQPISIYTRRVMDASKIDEYLNNDSAKGQVGGRNLGNTCFMNSSIACLSNCTELTYYFLKGDYLKDINEENNLGMRGELAREWGKLLKEYWVEDTRVGDPSSFKYTIGRKAERFRGYGQQDSNEFMSVFLDYLNEDLNKTTKKEYVELHEKGENETDAQAAKRFWDINLKRNDSIITDLFCGQFKSTITCPECGWINITFDPFDTINLPLLTQPRRHYHQSDENVEEFKFFYIPKEVLRNPYCLIIKNISNGEYMSKVIDRIKKEESFLYHDKIDDLLMVDMLRKEKYGYAEKTQIVRQFVYSEEYVFSFDYERKKDEILLQVYFYKGGDEKEHKSEYPRMVLCKKEDTLEDIRKKIYFYLRKYILSPFIKEGEEKDEVTLEIEKYMDDKNNELPYAQLYEMVENEYNKVFTKFNTDEEKEEDEKKSDKKDSDNENGDGDDSDDDNRKRRRNNRKFDEDGDRIDNNGEENDRDENENKNSDEEKNEEEKNNEEKKEEEKKDEENNNEEEKNNEEKKEEEKKEEENNNDEEKKNEDNIKEKNNEKNNEEGKNDNNENKEDKNNKEEKENQPNPEEKKEGEQENQSQTETKEQKTSPEEEELKQKINEFKADIPFTIFIRKERDDRYYYGKIPFIDSKNFSTYSKKLKEFLKINDFSCPLSDIQTDINDYEIIVQFNPDSKYINKDKFDLDHFETCSFEYKIKEKEEKKEKKEEEEEDDGRMTLAKCLKKFCKEEQLTEGDEWYCSKCKKHVLAKKKLDLFYLPKILIICFKRFQKDSSRWEKNEDEVDFPVDNLDMKDFVIGPDRDHSVYDLFAVSQHYGSTGFGHYTAVCKNHGKWFSYNDSSCSETNESDAQSSAAYVLFYRRQTD